MLFRSLHARLAAETTGLKRKLLEAESAAETRLQRVHMLEAQVAQLIAQAKESASRRKRRVAGLDGAGTGRRGGGGTRGVLPAVGEQDDASTVISDVSDEDGGAAAAAAAGADHGDDDAASLSTSLTGAEAFDFAPGENRLEVRCMG